MDNYDLVLQKMIERLARLNFAIIGDRTGTVFNVENETLELSFFGKPYVVTKKDCKVISGLPDRTKDAILIIDYLLSFGGLDSGDECIDFRDLPGALLYDGAFRINVESLLEGEIIENADRIMSEYAGLKISGYDQFDFAVAFSVFPRLRCLVLLSEGDDEIGAGAKVLFSSNAGNFMTTESLAVVAESLARRLASSANES
ncbi:MAG: DUF3786 domain-containing protein [Rubrobacteridae bacterium]|nr:DUF3786 domain-containing protein [Rubrobacteridae bacterium]